MPLLHFSLPLLCQGVYLHKLVGQLRNFYSSPITPQNTFHNSQIKSQKKQDSQKFNERCCGIAFLCSIHISYRAIRYYLPFNTHLLRCKIIPIYQKCYLCPIIHVNFNKRWKKICISTRIITS